MDRRPGARRRAIVALVAVLTLVAVTVTAAALAAGGERESRRFEQRATARQTAAVLTATVEQPVSALDGSDALVDADGTIDPAEFQRWGRGVLRDSPLVAVALARPLPQAERAALEAELGRPLADLVRPGRFRVAAERPAYWAVVMVTPETDTTRAVLGLDLTSDPVRSAALRRSLDERRTLLSEPTGLAGNGEPGLGLYHPLTDPGGNVVGALSAQIRVRTLTDAVRDQLPPGVSLRATDGDVRVLGVGTPGPGATSRTVEVLGRRWTLTVDRPAIGAARAPTILVGGLTATAFLAAVFLLWLRRDRRIESRQRLIEDLTANTPDPILIKDRTGRYLFANEAGARALGRSSSLEVVGRGDEELLHPESAAATRAHDRAVMASGAPQVFEESFRTSRGSRSFLSTRSPYLDGSGRVVGVFAVARDITERRQDERRRATVAALAAAVGSRATVGEVAEAAAATIRRALRADVVRVAVRSGERQLEVLAAEGAGRLADDDRYVPLDASHALATAAREQRVVAVRDREEWLGRFPEAGPMVLAEDLQATLCAPLSAAGHAGAISLSYRHPHDADEDLLRTVGDLTTVLGEALARARSTELERDAVATLQHALLPVDSFPDTPLDIAVRYSPALQGLELGGDWYDLFAMDDGCIGVVTGDVVGRGPAAAAVMGQLRAALRAISMSVTDPADVLRELDRFTATTDGAFCTTVFYGVLDPATLQFTYSSAGHLPPVLAGPWGSRLLDDVRGLPLGVVGEGADRPRATADLQPGDTLVVFTDGLVERRDRPIDDGLEHLAATVGEELGRPIEAFADRLLATADADAGGDDDTALLCLRVPARDATTLTCRLSSDLAELAGVRDRVRSWLGERGVADDEVDDLLLATVEAVTNSIEHGHRRDPHQQTVLELADDGDELTVTVRDRGTWNGRRPERDRGRGLAIIESVMDRSRITSNRHGTTLHMRKRVRRVADLPAEPSEPVGA